MLRRLAVVLALLAATLCIVAIAALGLAFTYPRQYGVLGWAVAAAIVMPLHMPWLLPVVVSLLLVTSFLVIKLWPTFTVRKASIAALAIVLVSVFLLLALTPSEEQIRLAENQSRLSYVPEGLQVSTVLYAKEESWGFGPGGNETGVIVYELPGTVARQIKQVGIDYLTALPPKAGDTHDWRGRYDQWQRTPILLAADWVERNAERGIDPATSTPRLENYLDKYGFGIPIEPNVQRMINDAISKPGSYYAYGRIGILIVIPDIQRVVYAYNG